jgi:hypothetical protein
MEYKTSEFSSLFPGYRKNQAIELKPFYHTDLKESLENIVFKEESKKGEGMLERVLSDKTKTLKSTIKALVNEIKLRESLNSHLLNNIDVDICRQHTYMGQVKYMKGGYSIEQEREKKKLNSKFENNVLELEKDKRKEYLECWRDLMFMNKYLLSALKDYWDLTKRRSALGYDLNNLTENENSE